MGELIVNFLVLAHKNPEQLKILIENLQSPNTYIYLHIDRKALDIRSSFENTNYNNTYIIPTSYEVNWGGFSQIKATLSLLKFAQKETLRKNAYNVLLSGQDLPLKPLYKIREYLSKNYGSEFIEARELPIDFWVLNGGLDRIGYRWDIDNQGRKKSFENYQNQKRFGSFSDFNFNPYGGSQWWILTQQCVNYVLDFIIENPDFVKRFTHTLIPDELFFHTIIMNSIFKDAVILNNLKYIDWVSGPEYPKMLTGDDYGVLNTTSKFFARKFDCTTHRDFVNSIIEMCKEQS